MQPIKRKKRKEKTLEVIHASESERVGVEGIRQSDEDGRLILRGDDLQLCVGRCLFFIGKPLKNKTKQQRSTPARAHGDEILILLQYRKVPGNPSQVTLGTRFKYPQTPCMRHATVCDLSLSRISTTASIVALLKEIDTKRQQRRNNLILPGGGAQHLFAPAAATYQVLNSSRGSKTIPGTRRAFALYHSNAQHTGRYINIYIIYIRHIHYTSIRI